MRRALAALLCLLPFSAEAQTAPSPAFPIPEQGVTFLTGDTWIQDGEQMRLFGVQSCVRGTSYTSSSGERRDCGEASLEILASLIRDTHPVCQAVAQLAATAADPPVNIVTCRFEIGGAQLDLGEALITQGFDFAAFVDEKTPVYLPYAAAEFLARKQRIGLWASPDFIHPNTVLFQALRDGTTYGSQTSPGN